MPELNVFLLRAVYQSLIGSLLQYTPSCKSKYTGGWIEVLEMKL